MLKMRRRQAKQLFTVLLVVLMSISAFGSVLKQPSLVKGFYTYDPEAALLSQTVTGWSDSISATHPSSSVSKSASGESFRSTSLNWNITKLSFNLKKQGSPTANLTANLYLAGSDLPTGSVLVVSTPINSSSLTTSFGWYNFTFSTLYMITQGTWYCAELQSTADGVINGSNYVTYSQDGSDVIEGKLSRYYSSAWHLDAYGWDLSIVIYGQKAHQGIIRQETSYGSLESMAAEHPSSSAYLSAESQTFRSVSGNYNITKIAFYLTKMGSPTENLSANIYANDSSGLPTGSALATSTPINETSLSGSLTWVNFTFATPFTLANATWYAMDIENNGGGTVNASNYPCAGRCTGDQIEGNLGRYYSSAWNAITGTDLDFIVYGNALYGVTFETSVAGSQFLVNGTAMSNSSVITYNENDVLNLSAVGVTNYLFDNFTWDSSSNTSQYTLVTVTSNLTIWANFKYQSSGYLWLSGWQYHKSHLIDSASGADVGYPVYITVVNGSGADSGSKVYENNKSNTDFSDVRFTSWDGQTLLGYFQENVTNGVNSTFLVSVDQNLTLASTTIYVYYGNAAASYIGSPYQVYGFYDDFSGSSLNSTNWDTVDSDGNFVWSVHESMLSVTNSKYDTQGTVWGFTHTGFPYQENFKVSISKLTVDTGTSPLDPMYDWGIVLSNSSSPWDAEISAYYHDAWVGDYAVNDSRVDSSTYGSAVTSSSTETANIIITKLGNNVTVYWNGVQVLTQNSTFSLQKILIEASCTHEEFQMYPYAVNTTIDLLSVRQFVDPEPVQSTWGVEETLYFVTYHVTAGGVFNVNDTAISDGTVMEYTVSENLNLSATPSAHYSFMNFTWDSGSSTNNPHILVTGTVNMTVWCYFDQLTTVIFRVSGSGNFTVNSTLTADLTTTDYFPSDVLNLTESPSTHYLWINYTWDSGSSVTSPYFLTVGSSNLTVWCYFVSEPWVTFYMNNGILSLNGVEVANATSQQIGGTTATLAGIGFDAYWSFSQWNFAVLPTSTFNPVSVTFSSTQNETVWLVAAFTVPVSAADAKTMTLYFRSDTWNMSNIFGYELRVANSYAAISDSITASGNLTVTFGFRVWLVDLWNNTIELTNGNVEAMMTRLMGENSSAMMTQFWLCPAYTGNIQALTVNIYESFDLGATWTLRVISISNNLYITLPSSTWQFNLYVGRADIGGNTTASITFGQLLYNSGITLEYYDMDPWNLALGKLYNLDLLGWLFMPWTYWIGDVFWTMMLFFVCVTNIIWANSLKPILAWLWIFGGSGSLLWALVPPLALHVAVLMLVAAMAFSLFNLVWGKRT